MEAKEEGSSNVEVIALRGSLQAYLPKWNCVGYQVHISRRCEEASCVFTTADLCSFALEVHRVFKDQLRLPTVQLTLTDVGLESEAKIECSGDQREYLPGVTLVSPWQQAFQEAWQPEPLAAMATFLRRALEKSTGPALRFQGGWQRDGQKVYLDDGVDDDIGPTDPVRFEAQAYRDFLAKRRNALVFTDWNEEASIKWRGDLDMINFTVTKMGGGGDGASEVTLPADLCHGAFETLISVLEAKPA